MEQSLQIGWVWSFYKAMSHRAGRFPFVKCSRAETFLSVFNGAVSARYHIYPTFDRLVPNNTEHLLNKELDI